MKAITVTLLLCLYILLQTWWYISTPLGQAPDEMDHVAYVCHLVEHGNLPVLLDDEMPQVIADIRWKTSRANVYFHNFHEPMWSVEEKEWREGAPNWKLTTSYPHDEAGQPPLAYLIPAVIIKMAQVQSPLERWHICRLSSVVFGFAAVVAGWYLGRRFWPERPDLGGLILGLWMMALPMAGFTRSVVSNDALVISVASWIFAIVIAHWNKASAKHVLIVSILLMVGVLVKASMLAVVPAVAWWGWSLAGKSLRGKLRLGCQLFAPAVLILGAYRLLAGDHWHYTDLTVVWNRSFSKPLPIEEAWLNFLRINVAGFPEGFFGLLGIARIHQQAWAVVTFQLLLVVTVWGLLASLLSRRKIASTELSKAAKIALGSLAVVGIVFLVGAVKELVLISSSSLVGRHLLIAQLPAGIGMIYGLATVLRRCRPKLGQATAEIGAGLALAFFCLVSSWSAIFNTLLGTFYNAPALREGEIFILVCGNLPLTLKNPQFFTASYYALAGMFVVVICWCGILCRPPRDGAAFLWLKVIKTLHEVVC